MDDKKGMVGKLHGIRVLPETMDEWIDEIYKRKVPIEEAKEVAEYLVSQRELEKLDALYWMYTQYCSDGHLFMGAGETASEILENAGYIKTDGSGRVVEDNGDSEEQRLKALQAQTGDSDG